mgnify:CR=1 FL=1
MAALGLYVAIELRPLWNDGFYYLARVLTLKHALLEWLDTNQDKILARDETPKEFHERFDALGQGGVVGGSQADGGRKSDNFF